MAKESDMTFYEETIEAIEESGHTEDDVMFIGSRDGTLRLSISEFALRSAFKYNNGFGSAQIARDLIVYFKDKSHMERSEYDGSEWWDYNVELSYSESDKYKPYECLCIGQAGDLGFRVSCGWGDLAEMNGSRRK